MLAPTTFCACALCCVQLADVFSYIVANGVVYLSAEERDYPKKLSLAYLDEVRREYEMQYALRIGFNVSYTLGTAVRLPRRSASTSTSNSVRRLLCSKIALYLTQARTDNFLQKTKKLYDDTNSQRNLSKVRARRVEPRCILMWRLRSGNRGASGCATHHDPKYRGTPRPRREDEQYAPLCSIQGNATQC